MRKNKICRIVPNKEFGYSGKSAYLPQFRPRIDLIGPPAQKVYLADGTKYRTLPAGPLQEHSTNGFTDYGAWRNRPLTSALQAYRDPDLTKYTYRHPGGIFAWKGAKYPVAEAK